MKHKRLDDEDPHIIAGEYLHQTVSYVISWSLIGLAATGFLIAGSALIPIILVEGSLLTGRSAYRKLTRKMKNDK